jgi:hypothetical protein
LETVVLAVGIAGLLAQAARASAEAEMKLLVKTDKDMDTPLFLNLMFC